MEEQNKLAEEMKEKKYKKERNGKKIWLKGLLTLLFVFLIFTAVSRAAAAFTVAHVRTGYCSPRKIRHTVTVEGRIEKNRELSVWSEPDIGVKAVFVSVGQRVKKGEMLAQLNMADLEEKLTDTAGEKRVMEMENKSLAKQKGMKHQIEANKQSILRLERQLRELQALKQKRGRIYAGSSGIITELLVNAGQKTGDGGILTMTDGRTGFLFVGEMDPDGAEYLSQGDTITLTLGKRKIKNLSVTSLALDENREFIQVSVLLPAKSASLFEPASITVVRDSENYPCTVPARAVFRENGKAYILLAESRDTILGRQQTAVKKEVKVLEENESYAALEGEALEEDCLVITDTDRYVEAGDTVRLIEE